MLTNDVVSFEQPGPELEIPGLTGDTSEIVLTNSLVKAEMVLMRGVTTYILASANFSISSSDATSVVVLRRA